MLIVEERVQKVELDPKGCMNLPLCLKVDFCILKVNSKCLFHYFAYYCLKNVCYPYLSLLTNTLNPVTTLKLLS